MLWKIPIKRQNWTPLSLLLMRKRCLIITWFKKRIKTTVQTQASPQRPGFNIRFLVVPGSKPAADLVLLHLSRFPSLCLNQNSYPFVALALYIFFFQVLVYDFFVAKLFVRRCKKNNTYLCDLYKWLLPSKSKLFNHSLRFFYGYLKEYRGQTLRL